MSCRSRGVWGILQIEYGAVLKAISLRADKINASQHSTDAIEGEIHLHETLTIGDNPAVMKRRRPHVSDACVVGDQETRARFEASSNTCSLRTVKERQDVEIAQQRLQKSSNVSRVNPRITPSSVQQVGVDDVQFTLWL